MGFTIFNFHDVILWMTAMQCLFFACLLVATNEAKLKSTYFLAAFLFAHAFIPVHEMILWGAEFKLIVRDHMPGIYFVGGAAYYLDGPLLYLCIKALVFRDFELKKRDVWHLIPVLMFIVFMLLTFYRLPFEQRDYLIRSEEFVYGNGYVLLEFMAKSMRVVYCVLCLVLISKYKKLRESTHSDVQKMDITWVHMLVLGVLAIVSMEMVLAITKVINLFENFHWAIFEWMGLSGYYMMFILVNLLVFTGIRYFASFEPVHLAEATKKPLQEHMLNPAVAAKISDAMATDKPFMEPDITLDNLAASLGYPPKDLSMVINRHFGVNFYEFINQYRVDEAKRMLVSEDYKNTTITDIYLMVGFNSKSVFYTFFKKKVGMTPSQYRRNPNDS
ncbi:helix-turn-helix domain-containing protein [Saccharophagus degradans]|uniref:helix-turn-helix domain-containing protein n=1 Tax=Saccharophagus degradans TaxID=86304 RepID=UPI0024780478|nr:helix-turn-helix domain-containing protein [Saccharophagus degradans]WGO99535.1 helix-turn-helix domain-containing protein [Saccharophagus degradans]